MSLSPVVQGDEGHRYPHRQKVIKKFGDSNPECVQYSWLLLLVYYPE